MEAIDKIESLRQFMAAHEEGLVERQQVRMFDNEDEAS